MNQQIVNDLLNAALLAGFPIQNEGLRLQTYEPGINTHLASALPHGYSAVYLFEYNNQMLKIGHCGLNCNPCFQGRHYGFNFPSTLARKLMNYDPWIHLYDEVTVGTWLKENTRRYNIYIPAAYGNFFRHFAESFLILKFNPLFEQDGN